MATELRPSVRAFAEAMELTLRKHEAKKGNQNGANGRPGWRQDPLVFLVDHAKEEMEELVEAVNEHSHEGMLHAAEEAVDLANMAMMVWDKILRLKEATDPN